MRKRERSTRAALLRAGEHCRPWLCCEHRWKNIRDTGAYGRLDCACSCTLCGRSETDSSLHVFLSRARKCTLVLGPDGRTRAWFDVGLTPTYDLSRP